MTVTDHPSVSIAFAAILLVPLLRFFARFYHSRRTIWRLRNQGLSMPPWNPIIGHLYFCYRIASALPKDAHPNYLPDMIRRAMPDLGPIYYLDTWPFGPQILVVASTHGLYQITQEHSLPKYHALKTFLAPIAEGLDIVTMEGDLWKTWRGIFNPGFSANHLMSLTYTLIEETVKFCDILQTRLEDQRTFKMKNLTDNLTMDIIGRVVLDTKLDSQRQSNPLVDALRMQVRWLTFGTGYNPVRPLIHWYNLRRMNNYVSQEIDNRIQTQGDSSTKGNKSIIDLVLTTDMAEKAASKTQLDSTFKRFTMSQIKLFLFSGHDTTSSTACYIFYTLAINPTILTRIRAEHDSILGLDTSNTASLITSDPFLLNKLAYTLAVIKETLRMYPAVSSARAGEPNFSVSDSIGRLFPTNGFLVWADQQPVHRDPAYWKQPDDFLPERWLVTPGDPLYPVKGAWRPFEYGPRNCIGQELALLEMKVIMVMTVRRFKIELMYEELDRSKGIRTVYGQRGYQIGRAQPSDDLPCRVVKEIS